ncbi:MAG: SWIM zinc finger family protein [Pyrobaculum sp.]
MQSLEEQVKTFLISLARILGVRIDKVLDLYFYVSPETVKIIEVVERGGEVVGMRLAVRSEHRPDVWYYVSVGVNGAKCTCEGNTIGGKLCKHIVIGVITWNMTSLIKKGRGIDLSSLAWLRAGDKGF